MNQYENINNNNFQEKIFYNNSNEIIEEINQSDTNNFSQLEQDIRILINFLRTNPIDFCNNLIQKNKYRQNQDQIEIINFIEDISRKQTLSEYIEIPELSSAARYLLDSISHHYAKFQNLNLKELDPKSLNLRYRLSNYGERTGRIFETVLFKMDNPEDIVNYILREEKGRNMLLNYKMKYIGIACDMLPSNFMCTVIDIVQDFVPYKEKQNLNNLNNAINNNYNNINNNTINNNLYNNNTQNMQNNKYNNYTYNNFNSGNIKNKFFYNQSNSEYLSLINNLNNKNSKENLKLKINIPENKSKEIEMNTNNIEGADNNVENNEIKNQNIQIKKPKSIYYKTPIKLPLKNDDNDNFSPNLDNPNEVNIKKIVPKRNNSNNINILKKENNNIEDIENLKNVKFTMAGRTFKQQQEIIEKSNKKNLNKSKSVCSFDVISNCSKTSNKNKFQRLNHEEKMEILHKINHRANKTPNSQSVSDKNSENANNINSNKNINNDYIQKNSNFEINFDNKSRKSPSRSTYNQEYYDILSETDKNNVNNLNKYMNKNYKNNNNFDEGSNQTFTDLRSNPGVGLGNNEEYSKNKINEIKNDLIYFKNQIKKELKDEVREEIRNEFNKKLLYENKQKNKPIIIHLERDYNLQNNNIYNNYDEREKINSFGDNNDITNDKIYYKQNNINNFINKNGNKNRCSSVEKYFYIKNNNNNINNINNTNIILPDNEIQYNQYTQNNFHKGRKSFDLNEFINSNSNNNNVNDDRVQIKEKYQQLKYTPIINNINNQDNLSNYSKGSYQNQQYINKENSGKKDINESFFNEGYKRNNRQEIKKLIKLYNIAKEDKRNRSLIENNNNNNKAYDIINNNKSISNYNFNPNNPGDNNIKIDINEDINNKNKININNNYIGNNNINNLNNNLEKLKNDFRNNYNLYENNINNEEENSGENDFVKGHRFQIKYEKVKPKGQVYNKSTIPKPRNSSVKKTHNYLNYNNVNNNSKSYSKENPFNKNEDIVNLENTHISNEKEEMNNKSYNNIEKDYIIEKKSYLKKYDEVKTYTNAENGKNENNINDKNDISSNNLNSIDKLSITGKFIDDNNINNNLESNNNLKSNDTVDIKNYMDKNITYKESNDKPVVSKKEKMDGGNIITTITTKTRKIYTPSKTGQNDEYIINKKVHKKQSDLIKEYKKYEKLENMNDFNDARSNDGANIYNNKIITKKLDLGRKTYDRVRINKNNKKNFIEIENDTLKTPNQFKKGYRHYENEYYNNTNISPRVNNNLNNKTNSYFKNKKYTPYPYYPYEYTVNYINDNNLLPSRRLNYNNNGSVEKKYIKDPEGNLIETYVKKTKYNDGSVLLEYI